MLSQIQHIYKNIFHGSARNNVYRDVQTLQSLPYKDWVSKWLQNLHTLKL